MQVWRFARTYEGLKLAIRSARSWERMSFARTYEGLKLGDAKSLLDRILGFARTYEGLKLPGLYGCEEPGELVLPVPMRD